MSDSVSAGFNTGRSAGNAGKSAGVAATQSAVGTPESRAKANSSFGAFVDTKLESEVRLALGVNIDLNKIVMLTTALKKEVRAQVGNVFGVSAGISAGGVGGTAGGGANLQAGAGIGAGFAGGASGKVGGVATGATSLGSGLGTRASLPNASGAPISFGTSSSGFGVGGQAGFGASAGGGGGISIGAAAKIEASLSSALDASLAGAGFSSEEQNSLKQHLDPALKKAVQRPMHSAFGPDSQYPQANGVSLLSSKIVMQERAAWTATVTIDLPEKDEDSPPPSGPFVIDMDGVEFRGTVVPDRAGGWGGTNRVRVVGGAGGLDLVLEPRNYGGGLTSFKTIFDDILRDSGESASSECRPEVLAIRFPAWQRSRGTAKQCLDVLCAKAGVMWRVLRDGTIWVGNDEWPEVEPAGTVMHEHHDDGVVKVAPDHATLVPGIIVRGQKVKQVVHTIDYKSKDGLRSDCHARSGQDLIGKILEKSDRRSEYSYRYRCKVTRQNADNTVDVLTDDERMKGRGVARCRIRAGFPGATIKVSEGARCLVGWDDGDPSLPYVADWEMGAGFVSIDIS